VGKITTVILWRYTSEATNYDLTLIFLGIFLVNPENAKSEISPFLPCSLVLETVNPSYVNSKGVVLVNKVKLTASFPRTSISIHANHLPKPSSFGEYDGFDGIAFIQNEISWRFRLHPTAEEGDPTWVGRFEDITADLANSKIEVRLSNLKTGKLGPVVLASNINFCKLC
jgi:hypothetical protein